MWRGRKREVRRKVWTGREIEGRRKGGEEGREKEGGRCGQEGK